MDEGETLGDFIKKSFLDLEKIDNSLYRSKSLWKSKSMRAVFGGQVIGQALVAASDCSPHDCHMHSMHAYFLQPGDVNVPMLYHVDVTRSGKTYASTSVKATQKNKAIFTMQASFKREEKNVSSFQSSMPKVPLPNELNSPIETLEKFKEKEYIGKYLYDAQKSSFDQFPIDVRFVKEEQVTFSTTKRQTLWMKVKGHLGDHVHPNMHKCCLAYMSDAYLLRAASIPFSWLHGSKVFSTSLDHSMWFHAPLRVDEWLLYDIEIENIGDGRTLLLGRVWDINGTLVTTIAQEGVLRLLQMPAAKL